MLATHVGDILWAIQDGYESHVNEILEKYKLKKVEQDSFRFCKREIQQHADFNVSVTCKDNAENIEPINYAAKGRKQTDPATASDISKLRSVVRSLAWVARQCRPDLVHGVSKLQSVAAKACLSDLALANKLFRLRGQLQEGEFLPDGAIRWADAHLISVTDASHAQEEFEFGDHLEPYRSQKGRMCFLSDSSAVKGMKMPVHLLSFSSTVIGRVCRSTLAAEAYSCVSGVEEGTRLRAALVDLRGQLKCPNWESSAAENMKLGWVTDCRSLSDHLRNPTFSKCGCKRLALEIAGLRQLFRAAP
jgi:hypothetical protein